LLEPLILNLFIKHIFEMEGQNGKIVKLLGVPIISLGAHSNALKLEP